MPCDLNELKIAATCFMSKCMGDPTRESIDLYLILKYLAAIGGTDYTQNIGALEVDANQWERLAESDRKAINTYTLLQMAIGAGAEFDGGTSANNLRTLSKCIECWGSDQRKNLASFAFCQINAVLNPENIQVIGGEGEGDVIFEGEGGGDIQFGPE